MGKFSDWNEDEPEAFLGEKVYQETNYTVKYNKWDYQAGEQLEAIMTQTKIVESSEDTMNVSKNEEIFETSEKVSQITTVHQWIFWLNCKYQERKH